MVSNKSLAVAHWCRVAPQLGTVFNHTPKSVNLFLSPALAMASLVEEKTLPALFYQPKARN